MTISKTLTLVDAPIDPRVGTFVTVEIPSGGPYEFGFASGARTKSATEPMSVDWGDGTTESVTSLLRHVHVYGKPGTYAIYVDDNLWRFAVSESAADSEYRTVYAPMVRALRVNATRMTTINQYAFAGAVGLAKVELGESVVSSISAGAFEGCASLRSIAGVPARVRSLPGGVFKDCSALAGRIDLPGVDSIGEDAQWNQPFAGCGALAEIHFAQANEEAIRATPAFRADPRLGAPNAAVVFDLRLP